MWSKVNSDVKQALGDVTSGSGNGCGLMAKGK